MVIMGTQRLQRRAQQPGEQAQNVSDSRSLADSYEAWNELRSLSRDIGTHVIESQIEAVRRRKRRRPNDRDESTRDCPIAGNGKRQRASGTSKSSPSPHCERSRDVAGSTNPDNDQADAERIKRLTYLLVQMQRLQMSFETELINLLAEEQQQRGEGDECAKGPLRTTDQPPVE